MSGGGGWYQGSPGGGVSGGGWSGCWVCCWLWWPGTVCYIWICWSTDTALTTRHNRGKKSDVLQSYKLAHLSAVVQHVAGGVVVGEPVTSLHLPTVELTGPGSVSEPVVSHDITLSQLTGTHLSNTGVSYI